MELYKILFKKSVEKDLKNIDKRYIPLILEAIDKLSKNPFPKNCRKLYGAENLYRIRVGKYRVIYSVDSKTKTITIYYVRHRKKAYKSV